MQYIHIYSEEKVVRLDFELDGNYEVGTTYEDYLNGAWVPLLSLIHISEPTRPY
mgnify:CR=1 FL=1